MEPAELSRLVAKLRDGDSSVVTAIIEGAQHIATKVAKTFTYKYPNDVDDIHSQALLGLVQAVKWIPHRTYNDSFEGYAWRTCVRHVKDYLERNHVVRVPYYAFLQHTRKHGGVEGLPQTFSIHRPNKNDYDNDTGHAANPFDPADVKQYAEFEFTDLCTILRLTDRERRIIDLRVKKFTLAEIGKKIGISLQMVFKIICDLRERYERVSANNSLLPKHKVRV
jgi:RNA polymerase sigma factor (sigma-70 family)